MIPILADLLDIGQDVLLIYGTVFLRVGAMMALLPAFGERNVPARVRLALAIGFSVIVAPAVAPQVGPVLDRGVPPLQILAVEMGAGLILGIALRLFVLALQMAGTIAAQATSLAQIFGGEAVDPQPALGHLMMLAGLALAVMTGLHVKVSYAIIQSYDVFVPGQMIPAQSIVTWGVSLVSHVFGLAFSLAAPFVIASLIYNLALGAINKAMPQLMVAFVGAPAITAGALLLTFLSLPLLLSIWAEAFDLVLANPMRVF